MEFAELLQPFLEDLHKTRTGSHSLSVTVNLILLILPFLPSHSSRCSALWFNTWQRSMLLQTRKERSWSPGCWARPRRGAEMLPLLRCWQEPGCCHQVLQSRFCTPGEGAMSTSRRWPSRPCPSVVAGLPPASSFHLTHVGSVAQSNRGGEENTGWNTSGASWAFLRCEVQARRPPGSARRGPTT